MEDAYQTAVLDPCTFVMGVFDGHQGSRCSEFLSENFHIGMDQVFRDLTEENNHQWELNDNIIIERIEHKFHEIDANFLDLARENDIPDGSTCCSAIVRGRKLYILNTGDSRAVICQGDEAILLTTDHHPDVPEEKERIEACGGQIVGKRVQGMLSVSRSFGDIDYKESEKYKDLIIVDPVVEVYDITPETKYILLACDGFWEKLSATEAVTLVNRRLLEQVPLTDIVSGLVKTAYDLGSGDNITLVLAILPAKYSKSSRKAEKKYSKKLFEAGFLGQSFVEIDEYVDIGNHVEEW
eukprot:TRINITY_DN1214_c0_g1_i2.p1 TRINITY_DN1214_c0_g1~~TRINITY_DN1214_c0_g1_i2.p1  ORF type:complete len:339 (-),score=71.79 TRINITY_DN1214_c0_g1_i2:1107-1994(-)